MRVFAAVFPPEKAVEDLARMVEPVQRGHLELRWTVPALWHLTLAFFADITRPESELLDRAVGELVRHRSALQVRLADAGAFPAPAAAQTLWAGVDCPDNGLGALSRDLIASVPQLPRTPQRRAFRPHLTLARARRPQDMAAVVEQLSGYRGPSWSALSLAVVWSHRSDDRKPSYDVLGEHPFPTG